MAVFYEHEVIDGLHIDKAVVGKKYFCADTIVALKHRVEGNDMSFALKLDALTRSTGYSFHAGDLYWALIYPYEEQLKKRMTNRQLAEWLAKGNGEYSYKNNGTLSHVEYNYIIGKEKEETENVPEHIVIRSWDSEEWIEPTLDVYMRDCKPMS